LNAIFERTEPDADATTFGVLALLGLVAAAATAAAAPMRPGAVSVLAWTAGTAVFWLCFNQLQLWNPYGFRYNVLVAPWMAVAAAWWLQTLPGTARKIAWSVSLAAAFAVSWTLLGSTHQVGWRAITQAEHSRGYFVYSRWRKWLGSLDRPAEPLRPALGYNEPVAAFYRLPVPRAVRPEAPPNPALGTAEDFMRGRSGWMVVSAPLFMGREGNVEGRTWLFAGDPDSPFSVAAYRALQPGESPRPMVYRRGSSSDAHAAFGELLVRSWSDRALAVSVRNAGRDPCHFVLSTPAGTQSGVIAGGAASEVQVPMPKGAVGEIAVRFDRLQPSDGAPEGTSIDLAE
jgi:hypothetical protein